MRRTIPLLALLLLGACLDFVDPTSPWDPNQSAHFSAFVHFTVPEDSLTPSIARVNAQMFPGTDEIGVIRTPESEMISVLDTLLSPASQA